MDEYETMVQTSGMLWPGRDKEVSKSGQTAYRCVAIATPQTQPLPRQQWQMEGWNGETEPWSSAVDWPVLFCLCVCVCVCASAALCMCISALLNHPWSHLVISLPYYYALTGLTWRRGFFFFRPHCLKSTHMWALSGTCVALEHIQ